MVHGIVEYTIQNGKIVTGVFSNDTLEGHQFCEILFKRGGGLPGSYSVSFYDNNGKLIEAELEVQPDPNHKSVYRLSWRFKTEKEPAFIGRGYMLSENRLTASYHTA